MFSWGDEQVEQLRVLAAEGLTASQIAWRIGTGRSAVIGKMRRVGIPLRGAKVGWAPHVPRPRHAAAPQERQPEPEPEPAGPAGPVHVLEITRGQCHWPVTDNAPWMYCGAKTSHGAYCREHYARMYQGHKRDVA